MFLDACIMTLMIIILMMMMVPYITEHSNKIPRKWLPPFSSLDLIYYYFLIIFLHYHSLRWGYIGAGVSNSLMMVMIKMMMMINLLETFLLSNRPIRNKHVIFVCRLANMFVRNRKRSPSRELTIYEKSNQSPLSKDERPSSKDMPAKDSCRGLTHIRKDTAKEREPTIELSEALDNLCK